MADRVSVGGGATVATLARGSLATLSSYRHDTEVPHRDPEEERFHRPTLIFTSSGAWEIRSAVGRDRVDPSMIVLGEAGRSYRASHEERIPSDRTMFLELSEPDEWSAFGRTATELFQEVFSRQAVRRTREIARLQAALVSCDPGDTFGSLRTDVLSVELLIELAGVAPGANVARNHPSGHPRARGASPWIPGRASVGRRRPPHACAGGGAQSVPSGPLLPPGGGRVSTPIPGSSSTRPSGRAARLHAADRDPGVRPRWVRISGALLAVVPATVRRSAERVSNARAVAERRSRKEPHGSRTSSTDIFG